MNPNNGEQPAFNMPQPGVETNSSHQPVTSEKSSVRTEHMPVSGFSIPQVQTAVPIPAPMPPQSVSPSTPSATTSTNSAAPATAADNDLIEKEWIVGAKRIVENTKEDPRIQSNQLSRYKADYMKKRYNKELKVADG